MNIIPSIFNERQIKCAILGGKENNKDALIPISVILLNSGGIHQRLQNLENLLKNGFEDIISVETNSESYNMEDFVKKFPSVKFIIPLEKATQGDILNIGMREIKSDYVLVLRDTINITPTLLGSRIATKIVETNQYCIVPHLVMNNMQSLPIQFIPLVEKSVLRIKSSSVSDGKPTLYPFDFIGIYNRKKFIQLGGFDYTILNPYWQNLDLSFRAWLWGEKISLLTGMQLSYSDKVLPEDSTPDFSQIIFYLKNMLPHYKVDHGVIPFSSLFVFMRRSSAGPIETYSQFKNASRWVKINQFRFKRDAHDLLSNWGKI